MDRSRAALALSLLVLIAAGGCLGTAETPTTAQEPRKGDDLLSVEPIDAATAAQFADSERAAYGNLTRSQQDAFDGARRCECASEQDVFLFDEKERVKAVKYDGEWYALRVAIV